MKDEDPRRLDGCVPPQQNTVLFGHEEAEDFLAQSYRSGKSHHAMLIEGPEGIGKATLAFRFAHHVLAHPDPATAPDHLSAPDTAANLYHQVASGACHNLIHLMRPIDEKSGKLKAYITVEEARRAARFFEQTSGNGNWRIVLLDTADDLNRNAANAILKILEEPPKMAMFLVLSHHPGRLLATIRSRCLQLKLRPLGDEAMALALNHIGLPTVGEKGKRLIAASLGSVSRAVKLVNYGGMEIIGVFDALMATKGAAQRREMHRLADVLAGKDKEIAFDFFANHMGEILLERAKTAALNGQLQKADTLSRLYSTISERLSIADAYNLDRKQTVLGLLDDLTSNL